jgi:hypothetical protein
MTLRGCLIWCLGAGTVVFIGTAGVSGYQLLSRQHARSLAQGVSETSSAASSTPSLATAATDPQPTVPAANPAPASPSSAAPRSTAALLPPLRQHVASATAAPGHASRPEKRAARRSAAPLVAAHHPAPRRPALAAATAQLHVPSYRPSGYAAPRQPGALYPPPPPSPVTYYPYHGYYGYRSGYAYDAAYPRYPYYPVN